MPKINIAFDGKSPQDLKDFIRENKEIFASGNIHIKLNDLIAEIGIDAVKNLAREIKDEDGVDIIWMIDGKWYDIPNTVANYARRLDGLNVAYYTVHASGGPNMIRAVKKTAPDKKLLAITVLTSMEEDEIVEIFDANRTETVLRLAKSALGAGADGLVCSPADAPMLRQVFGSDFLLVTPNIQREGIERHDDQNKALTNTPRGAIENGASDIVVGRPILNAENPSEVIGEMLEQMNSVPVIARDEAIQGPELETTGSLHASRGQEKFTFEKILHTGDWESLLKYIGAIYRRPEGGKYVRLTSGMLSDTYINIGASERDYRVLDRASHELAQQMRVGGIEANHIMGAQMGSVRLSVSLARAMSISESTYTEKDGDAMALKRHDIGENGFKGKKVVLSEDVITKGSTLAKMVEIVRNGGGEVVAVTCVVNRSGKDNHDGIPLFHSYVPPTFGMWWDEKTLDKTQANEIAAGKTEDEARDTVALLQMKNTILPPFAEIAEKPKNEWNALVNSMR